ncbi:MAG: ferredoxin--NADP reductase [Myxococcales bacterium]|nr:ferredoxin--NADP reductase [Myxococcales bacterium]
MPEPLRERVEQLGRDLEMLVNLWRGRRPPPFRTRVASGAGRGGVAAGPGPSPGDEPGAGPRAGALATRALEIVALTRETDDAVTLTLADPDGGELRFVPGQFFTVLVDVGGETLRRAYSLSSSALERERASVTIKRVSGGRASNHLNDHAAVGQRLLVLGPSGAFTVAPSPAARRVLVLIAGGSGITPIAAIVRTVLAVETSSKIALIYGNRGAADIIFRAQLDALAREHEGRLELRHVLSDPPAGWAGGVGLLDRETCLHELARLETRPGFDPETLDDAEYFVCGPEPMMEAVRDALREFGVPRARVHEERFSQPHLRGQGARARARAPRPQGVQVRRAGLPVAGFEVAPEQTLLEAGLTAGLPLSYSCAMGGCGACKVRLVEGEVEMEEPNCLTDEERARGEVLACVCRPLAGLVIDIGPRRAPGLGGAARGGR